MNKKKGILIVGFIITILTWIVIIYAYSLMWLEASTPHFSPSRLFNIVTRTLIVAAFVQPPIFMLITLILAKR